VPRTLQNVCVFLDLTSLEVNVNHVIEGPMNITTIETTHANFVVQESTAQDKDLRLVWCVAEDFTATWKEAHLVNHVEMLSLQPPIVMTKPLYGDAYAFLDPILI